MNIGKESGPKNKDQFDIEEERDWTEEGVTKSERHAERVAEILSRPQQIFVKDTDIAILKSVCNVVLSGVALYGRKLHEGEKVILLGEDMIEVEAEFESIDDGIFGRKIKVRLPSGKGKI